MLIDSTTFVLFERMGMAFGLPIGWMGAGVAASIMFVNTLKSLAPTLLTSNWYPAVAFAISAAYSYATLRPSWTVIGAGAVGLFAIQWITWFLAKRAATAAGWRTK